MKDDDYYSKSITRSLQSTEYIIIMLLFDESSYVVYSPFFIDNLGSAPLALKSPLVKLRSSFVIIPQSELFTFAFLYINGHQTKLKIKNVHIYEC